MASRSETELCLSYLDHRFGIPPEALEGHYILATSRTFYMLRKTNMPSALSTLSIQQAGLPLLRKVGRFLKPTTCAAQLLGRYARRGVVAIKREELVSLATDGELPLDKRRLAGLDEGYVLLRLDLGVIGVSLFVVDEKGGRLLCRLPKAMRIAIVRR